MKRSLAGWLRLTRVRSRLGRDAISGDTAIGAGTRIAVTDGGRLRIGPRSAIGDWVTILVKFGQLQIGARSFVGNGSVMVARESIIIGDDALIAEHVTIRDQDHRYGEGLVTSAAGFVTAPIVIGDNVWIGAKATITRGVTIGDNSVIGANSVVTVDIPANVVAAGTPATVIRPIEPGSQSCPVKD